MIHFVLFICYNIIKDSLQAGRWVWSRGVVREWWQWGSVTLERVWRVRQLGVWHIVKHLEI